MLDARVNFQTGDTIGGDNSIGGGGLGSPSATWATPSMAVELGATSAHTPKPLVFFKPKRQMLWTEELNRVIQGSTVASTKKIDVSVYAVAEAGGLSSVLIEATDLDEVRYQ
jgi:hypothetical protein